MRVQRAPSKLAESLLETARSGDAGSLREFLQGRFLPASGGDLSPADIIYRACEEVADRLEWDGLAWALDRVISEAVAAARTKPLNAEQVYLLRNALDLAAELVPSPGLGSVLYRLFLLDLDRLPTKLFLPLLRALVFHQKDDQLEDRWLEIIAGPRRQDWTPEERTILLTAWRGLLWIPTMDDRSVVDFNRIDRGLIALSQSVEKRPESRKLLMSALGILRETYPRSVEFWEEHLAPHAEHWSPILREVAYSQWPDLGAPLQRRRLAG
jgi:hypothetical protein